MDNASFFIKNRALFGSFPTQESVDELEKNGVRYFINLTDLTIEKNIIPYKTNYVYFNYPIIDNYIPTDLQRFASFIIKISKIIKSLKRNELLYLHCRAGHSRSAIVVACVICYIFNLNPSESLEYTTICHSNRVNLRERRRKLGAPQSFIQKRFVYKFFEPLLFVRNNKFNTFTYGFSAQSLHPIITKDMGIFPTVDSAYNAYIEKYTFENNTDIENTKDNIKIEIMTKILKLKFEQHSDLKENLLNTGLRILIEQCKEDYFWSSGYNGKGRNQLGIILMKIRNEYYEKNI